VLISTNVRKNHNPPPHITHNISHLDHQNQNVREYFFISAMIDGILTNSRECAALSAQYFFITSRNLKPNRIMCVWQQRVCESRGGAGGGQARVGAKERREEKRERELKLCCMCV
jgi:hypothetical protein